MKVWFNRNVDGFCEQFQPNVRQLIPAWRMVHMAFLTGSTIFGFWYWTRSWPRLMGKSVWLFKAGAFISFTSLAICMIGLVVFWPHHFPLWKECVLGVCLAILLPAATAIMTVPLRLAEISECKVGEKTYAERLRTMDGSFVTVSCMVVLLIVMSAMYFRLELPFT